MAPGPPPAIIGSMSRCFVSMGLAAVVSVGLAACGHSHGDNDLLGEVVVQNDASDEAFANLADTYDQMGSTVSAMASDWVGPAAATPLEAATAPTFEWTEAPVSSSARHGTSTGRFVWLHLEAEGDDLAIDVASVKDTDAEPTTFTPTAAQWTRLAAGGTITARLVTAQLDRGNVVSGPFEPADSARTFTIGE